MKNTLVCLSLLLLNAAAQAAPFTWDGGAGDNNWQSATNWSGNVAPAADGTASLVFSGETRTSAYNDFGSNTVFAGLAFANNRSPGMTAAFTLSGNPIVLGGNVTATLPTADGTITDTIALPILLNGTRTFTPYLNLILISRYLQELNVNIYPLFCIRSFGKVIDNNWQNQKYNCHYDHGIGHVPFKEGD